MRTELFITFMHCIYSYVTETNRVFRVHTFVPILRLQFVLHVMLFHKINGLYFYINIFRSIRAVSNMADFSSSLMTFFQLCCSGIFRMLLLLLLFINIPSFMYGIYTYIPETNPVPRGHTVAADLSIHSLVLISYVPALVM